MAAGSLTSVVVLARDLCFPVCYIPATSKPIRSAPFHAINFPTARYSGAWERKLLPLKTLETEIVAAVVNLDCQFSGISYPP